MKVSIIIPVKEINHYIRESIPYLLNLNYDDYEILILPDFYKEKMIFLNSEKIKVIESGRTGPAEKRDLGAKEAEGKILAFIDDDAYPKKDWLRKVVRNFKANIVAVGGPAITPLNDSLRQKASGIVFETLTGGGGMDYRYKPKKRRFVDDFPTVNFSVLKKVFLEIGGFDSNYWPGEDTEFCLKLINKGYRIIYDPQAVVYHHRRELFKEHLKQISQYGKHRGRFARTLPDTSFRLTYLMPSLFVLFLIIGFIISFFSQIFLTIFLLLIATYFVIITFDVAIRVNNINILVLAVLGVFLTHIFYGVNFLYGFMSGKSFKSRLK